FISFAISPSRSNGMLSSTKSIVVLIWSIDLPVRLPAGPVLFLFLFLCHVCSCEGFDRSAGSSFAPSGQRTVDVFTDAIARVPALGAARHQLLLARSTRAPAARPSASQRDARAQRPPGAPPPRRGVWPRPSVRCVRCTSGTRARRSAPIDRADTQDKAGECVQRTGPRTRRPARRSVPPRGRGAWPVPLHRS